MLTLPMRFHRPLFVQVRLVLLFLVFAAVSAFFFMAINYPFGLQRLSTPSAWFSGSRGMA
jgi:hypothetical protein